MPARGERREHVVTRYQLARLVQWAGILRTRKRLQKTVYLMKRAGAPFSDAFCLHRYGPYSHDLADTTDEMVAVGLLEEDGDASGYSYSLADGIAGLLERFEARDVGRLRAQALDRFRSFFEELNEIDSRILELAATIGFHLDHGRGLPDAVEATCKHKGETPGSDNMEKAKELAVKRL